jgi:hypothetical protein
MDGSFSCAGSSCPSTKLRRAMVARTPALRKLRLGINLNRSAYLCQSSQKAVALFFELPLNREN